MHCEEVRNGAILITQWGLINDYYKVNAIGLCEKTHDYQWGLNIPWEQLRSLQLHKWGHTYQGLWRHAKPALDKNRRHEQVICPIYPILSLLQ